MAIVAEKSLSKFDDFDVVIDYVEQETSFSTFNFSNFLLEKDKLLKKKFLEFVDSLGKSQHEGRGLVQFMRVSPRFSYWWQTTIATKDPFETSYIFDFYKLYAIQLLCEKYSITSIHLETDRVELVDFLQSTCETKSIDFTSSSSKPLVSARRGWYQPSIARMLVAVLNKKFSAPRRGPFKRSQRLVVTYFPNFDIKDGMFVSRYFNEITGEIAQGSMWLFLPLSEPTPAQLFSLDNSGLNYQFLDSFLTLGLIFRAVFKTISLRRKFGRIPFQRSCTFEGVDYYPIVSHEWKNSISQHLFKNTLQREQFGELIRQCAPQHCIYLYESLAWEHALLDVLDEHGISSTGVVHATVRPNLLNFFHHKLPNYCPRPTKLAINSQHLKLDFIDHDLVEIEAQRYSYLNRTISIKKQIERSLLVATSMNPEENLELLTLLAKSNPEAVFDRILLKPHPMSPVESIVARLPDFPIHTLVSSPLIELFPEVMMLFCANSSSVIMEGLACGVQTVTHFSLDTLPVLAIDSHPLLHIVTNNVQLEKCFSELLPAVDEKLIASDYFFLDDNFPRWNALLDSIR